MKESTREKLASDDDLTIVSPVVDELMKQFYSSEGLVSIPNLAIHLLITELKVCRIPTHPTALPKTADFPTGVHLEIVNCSF